MEYPPSDRRSGARSYILVTQVKMGDQRKYFFGYARNISRSGAFVHTLSPKKVGEEFDIELSLPGSAIFIKCRAKVVWARSFAEAGENEPGMGLEFLDLGADTADHVEDWVKKQKEKEEGR